MKIVTILLFCGLALPAYSLAAEKPSGSNTPGTVADQQQIKVSGTITDASTNQGMPGVNIQVKGTTIGAISDANGKFTLTANDPNATVVFSFIGYVTQEIALSGQTTLSVVLTAEVSQLSEVVVIGYGTAKKATLTGSVSSVNGENLKQSPTTNLTNSLVGRLPGITAQQKSGEPGYDNTTITIRGANTLGDNSPLVVVDGIPHRSLERLDPSDIESFTVLKDASAAIYGTQAANGVILVTTKRGKIGKPTITLNMNSGYNQPGVIPKMADAATYATMLNEIAYYAAPANGRYQQFSADDITKFQDGSDPWGHPNTDWFKATFKPWSKQNYENISVSGGTENMRYFLSLGSKYQDAYYKNSATDYRQYDFRSNIDGKISENIAIAFDVAGRQENKNFPTVSQGNIFRMIMRGKPNMPAYWPDGNPGPDIEYGFNPVVTVTSATGSDDDRLYALESNLKLNVKIPWVKGLQIQANGSFDKNFRYHKRFETPWYLYTWNGQPDHVTVKGIRGLAAPQLTEDFQDGSKTTFNSFATYETTIDQRHNLKLMVGTENQYGINNYLNAFRKNYVTSAIPQMFAGAADTYMTNGGYADQNARRSYFGRVNYDFNQRYLIELVMRYDGSYMFKPGKQYGFFPGISAGWRVSDENFWKNNISFISDFKLRASWGQTGNDRIYYGTPSSSNQLREYQYLSTYSFDGQDYVFGQNVNNKMLYENVVPNPDVTWEVANQSNIGFDATLLNKKLTVNADFFYNLRSRILWQATAIVPTSTGMILPPQNIGKVSNTGFEYVITYHGGNMSGFYYDLSLNGSYAKNKVDFSYDTPGIPEYQKIQGSPMGAGLNYLAIGIFKDQAAVDAYPHWAGAQGGDIIFKDVNNDGVIDWQDKVRDKKNNMPRFIGGFNAVVGYKQFDMSMLFQGAAGAIVYLGVESGDIGNYYETFAKNRWTPENNNTTYPRAWNRDNEYWRNQGNSFWQFSTDYVRLKSLEIGYTLPSGINQKLGIAKLRIYANGVNLVTLDKIKLIDPEVDAGTSYPLQRIVNLGLTLTF